MSDIAIRVFRDSDRASVIRGLVDLQNFEVPLHDTRLPGEDTAELYFDRMRQELAEGEGEIFIAEQEGAFVGFVGCLVVQDDVVQETPTPTAMATSRTSLLMRIIAATALLSGCCRRRSSI